MKKGIQVGLMTARTLRLIIAVILLVVFGRLGSASGQTETNLYSFGGSPDDGTVPHAGLVQGSDGNFYGTTLKGGTNGVGTVFRISANGGYSNLYSFVGSGNDGANPWAGLFQGSDGNFYGTTEFGGTNGGGTVFRISPSGSYTNLYSIGGSRNDGSAPDAGLVQGSDGNFYGTTSGGGANNNGTVFRISPSGSYTNLHSFNLFNSTNGSEPDAGLVQGSDGNFYGTTSSGGANGGGTVFRISPSGSYTNLYSFPDDEELPFAGLVQGSDGNFYGTTLSGGMNSCTCGTVFRISPCGSYTNLHSFAGFPNDGANPFAGLVQGSDGNFYGTTYFGGLNDSGTVFRISPGGSETSLYSFVGSPTDGANPQAGLVQGSDGNFYGTTGYGGAINSGTVFRISIPLNPRANQISGIQLFSVFDTTDVAVSIPSVAGEKYQLQYSDSMSPVNWFNTGDPVTSIGGPLILTDFAESLPPERFYRAVITP